MVELREPMKIAIVDDYQNVALEMAIDVFEEPLPAQHPFRSLDNMLATPRIGYVSESLYRTFYGDSQANITAWLDRQDKDKAE
jgi:phosphoglycerate dehydrogenase-like enzyme